MHTSTRLTSSDFNYWRLTDNSCTSIPFTEFCPDYHELDRVGVVSPALQDGVMHVGKSLLALTTIFYDCHRARGGEFFDYPQHFAFVGSDDLDNVTMRNDTGKSAIWGAWSWLDVWPSNKWITAAPTASSLLQSIFDYQINHLFWPLDLWPMPNESLLPDYAYRMLRTRLKSVYLYIANSQIESNRTVHKHPDPAKLSEANPSQFKSTLAVGGSSAAEALLQESIGRLPALAQQQCNTLPALECFESMPVAEFITRMKSR